MLRVNSEMEHTSNLQLLGGLWCLPRLRRAVSTATGRPALYLVKRAARCARDSVSGSVSR
jgi:hypothetical protein